MFRLITAAWRFRHFIRSSVRNEFAVRFARSRLGGLWMILNPLAQAAIVAFALSGVLAAKLPGIDNRFGYAIYLMAGMLGWSLFLETVTRCLTVFTDNATLLKKLVFPRICLPLVVAGVAIVGNLLLMLATFLVCLALGHGVGAQVLWLPLLMLVNLALALGVGLALGVVNVFLRDVGQVVPILLQFTFWLTPIVYVPSILPQAWLPLLNLNPVHGIVSGYQRTIVLGQPPDWGALGASALFAAAALAFALFLFRRANAEMVDVL